MFRSLSLSAALVVVGASIANACSTTEPSPTTEELFAKARAVFAARMVRTEEAQIVLDGKTWPIVEGTFRTIEVLKGEPPQDQKVRSLVYGPGNCTMPLLSGWDYVFFLGPSVFADSDHNLVWWANGSFGTFNLEGTEPKRKLEELRKLSREGK